MNAIVNRPTEAQARMLRRITDGEPLNKTRAFAERAILGACEDRGWLDDNGITRAGKAALLAVDGFLLTDAESVALSRLTAEPLLWHGRHQWSATKDAARCITIWEARDSLRRDREAGQAPHKVTLVWELNHDGQRHVIGSFPVPAQALVRHVERPKPPPDTFAEDFKALVGLWWDAAKRAGRAE